MGYNTVVMLLNDMTHEWPDEIQEARHRLDTRKVLPGRLRYGQVICEAHADHWQITAVGRNTGYRLGPTEPVPDGVLQDLAVILQGHGYTVRAPGKKRGDGPLSWGYAAQGGKKARATE